MTHAAAGTAKAAAEPPRRPYARPLAGILLVMAAALLYSLTLDNGLQPGELHGGDLITHQYAQVQARPSNAPGYPIYTLGGWLWFHGIRNVLGLLDVEHPNPIPILSAYSTLWALIALWLLYEIICMVTEGSARGAMSGQVAPSAGWWIRGSAANWPVAFLIGAFYAVTYFFWYYATTTEQYSSAIAHTLSILFVFLLWRRHRDGLWLLYMLAFLCGLSLAHMLTVSFIVPPIVLAVLWLKPDLLRSPKAIVGSVLAAALPLAAYGFVYVRGSQHPEWWGSQEFASASDWFWRFVSTTQGREELMWAFEPGRAFLGNGFPNLIGQELTWIMVIAGLIGIGFLHRPLTFVLYVTLALYLFFSWAYRFGNWFQVILPAYALLMIGVGAAADRWQTFAAVRPPRVDAATGRQPLRTVAVAAPLLLLAFATVWRFDASLAMANSRNRPSDTALDRAAVLLDGPLPEGAALFASVDDALALQYLTDIWGIRPDVHVVSSDEASDRIAQQPVYATWEAAPTLREELGLVDNRSATVISPDWVVITADGRVPSPVSPASGETSYVELQHEVAPQLVLAGYTVQPAPDGSPVAHASPPAYDVTLDWRTTPVGWPDDVSISLRPTLGGEYIPNATDPDAVLVSDHAQPAQLLFDGEGNDIENTLADPYRITFPPDSGQEDIGIAVVVYSRQGDRFVDLARIDLPLPASQLPNPQ